MPGDERKSVLESPIRVEIKADGTKTLEAGARASVVFVERVIVPPAEGLAMQAREVIDCVRGPFQDWRIQQLAKLAERVRKLGQAQGIESPKALPPRVIHTIVEEASFVEDDDLRTLWAQLIVNAQAGIAIDNYLFSVLSRMSSDDVVLLQKAGQGELDWDEGAARLHSLGLVTKEYRIHVKVEPVRNVFDIRKDAYDVHETETENEFEGYLIAPMGEALLEAVSCPKQDEFDTTRTGPDRPPAPALQPLAPPNACRPRPSASQHPNSSPTTDLTEREPPSSLSHRPTRAVAVAGHGRRWRIFQNGPASTLARYALLLAANSAACGSEPAPQIPTTEVTLPKAPVPGGSGGLTTDDSVVEQTAPAVEVPRIEESAAQDRRVGSERDDVDLSKAIVVPLSPDSILIDATLEGPGGAATAPYTFDTAASFTTVSTAMARRIGLEIPPDAPKLEFRVPGGLVTHPLVRLPAFQVGATRLEGVLVSVCDACVDERIGTAGLLGNNVIREFLVEMDYRNAELVLLPWTSVTNNRASDLEVMVQLSVKGPSEVQLGAVAWSVEVENLSSYPMKDLRPVVAFDGGPRLVGTTIDHLAPRASASSQIEGRISPEGSVRRAVHYVLGLETGRW